MKVLATDELQICAICKCLLLDRRDDLQYHLITMHKSFTDETGSNYLSWFRNVD
jgi:hypothetical protein